jgi:hypothetical protein
MSFMAAASEMGELLTLSTHNQGVSLHVGHVSFTISALETPLHLYNMEQSQGSKVKQITSLGIISL